jgi:hypothetical protein
MLHVFIISVAIIIGMTSNRNYYMGNFWAVGYSWIIPKIISKITTSFSSLTISFF